MNSLTVPNTTGFIYPGDEVMFDEVEFDPNSYQTFLFASQGYPPETDDPYTSSALQKVKGLYVCAFCMLMSTSSPKADAWTAPSIPENSTDYNELPVAKLNSSTSATAFTECILDALHENDFRVSRVTKADEDVLVIVLESEAGLSVDVYPDGVLVAVVSSGPHKGIYEFDFDERGDMLSVLNAGRSLA